METILKFTFLLDCLKGKALEVIKGLDRIRLVPIDLQNHLVVDHNVKITNRTVFSAPRIHMRLRISLITVCLSVVGWQSLRKACVFSPWKKIIFRRNAARNRLKSFVMATTLLSCVFSSRKIFNYNNYTLFPSLIISCVQIL